jgi:hypothetical protein
MSWPLAGVRSGRSAHTCGPGVAPQDPRCVLACADAAAPW